MSDIPDPKANGLRGIAVWVRRYAENRTLPMVVFLVVFLLLWCAYVSIPFLLIYAFRARQWLVCAAGACLLLLAIVANSWLAVPAWGGRWMERLAERFYRREGRPVIGEGPWQRHRAIAAVILLLAGITAGIVLGLLGILPDRLMQPFSALYVVPALFIISRRAYLWAILYAVHALLIVAGAPILFSGQYDMLNMLIPTVGYGLLSALIGHLISRIALAKMRRLSRQTLEGGLHG